VSLLPSLPLQTEASFSPIRVSQLLGNTIVEIAAGENHSVAVVDDKEVYCWGCNRDGQLGLPQLPAGSLKHPAVPAPTKVDYLSGKQIFQVSCGASHTAALCVTGARFVKQSSDGIFHRLYYGEIFTWGGNRCGQLGHPRAKRSETRPEMLIRRVSGMAEARIVRMASGHFHMMALQEDGVLWGWGFGEEGRLGTGREDSYPTAVRVPPIPGLKENRIVKVHCGGSHSMALTDDGKLYTWGRNREGQLGHGDTRNRLRPTLVSHFAQGGRQVVHVSGGNINTGALTRNGRIFTWGCTRHGESATIPKVAKGMLSAEGHSVHCGYHTTFMVMRSMAKKGPLDHNSQQEYEGEMELFRANEERIAERERHRVERIILTPKDTQFQPRANRPTSTHRVCQKQASSAPVTVRILSLDKRAAKTQGRGASSRREGSSITSEGSSGRQPGRRGEEQGRPWTSGVDGGLAPPHRRRIATSHGEKRPQAEGVRGKGEAYQLRMDEILERPTTLPGDRIPLHRFLQGTGATGRGDFQERWAGLLEAEMGGGGAEMYMAKIPNPYDGPFGERELLEIGRATQSFRLPTVENL